ncbi:LysR substrate-binding domain-containing protein [Sagittula stellata]|uniref:Transcriptional regulator, LysR family protein n=1 Tax=Sagittula stellata (strain ATCC 700073 / DSM 11524 / E-37) TaxID=388399 RepID=A3K3F4_SAGS3|nr:LysR substrate-binding domain-containing protein [Sagittula stellata]EBA08068.1 transcriptional regulator, LysR family protein [Sagittula stellata E-37]
MHWSRLPSLAALRAFAAYAETGSVSAAGDTLNVSHAAISQQLRALEAHLGLALLDRTGRKMALTADGDTLARTLRESFGQIATTLEALTGADADRPLLISTTPTFASGWLLPRLASFRAEHPEINLMIDPSADVRGLEPGGIDMALRYGNGSWPGLQSELFVRSPIVVVAAPGLVGDRPIESPADLSHLHWLQEYGTNEATSWFAQFGIERDSGLGFTSLPGNMMLEAARQGQGVAILARVFAEPDIAAGRLRLLFEDTRSKGYWIVTRPGVPRPPLKAFLRWLQRNAEKS